MRSVMSDDLALCGRLGLSLGSQVVQDGKISPDPPTFVSVGACCSASGAGVLASIGIVTVTTCEPEPSLEVHVSTAVVNPYDGALVPPAMPPLLSLPASVGTADMPEYVSVTV